MADKIQSTKRTAITHEDQFEHHAPHYFQVIATNESGMEIPVGNVNFQNGAIDVAGVNGVMNEDLLHMVKVRLEGFQASPFKCEENQKALDHINAALEALESRTKKREKRGVEGTHNV